MSAVHEPEELDGPHEGPIKTPKQLILTVLFAFLVPIFGIVLLVMFVTADKRPAAGSSAMTTEAIAERIRPVGVVEIKDASDVASMKTGEQVFAARPSSATSPLGGRGSSPASMRCCIRRSPARARCRRKAAATSATSRSPARSST